MSNILQNRPTLRTFMSKAAIDRSRAEKIHRMFYQNGPGYGTFLGLPFDQLVEHGPGHEFKWNRSARPEAVIELANKGNFSSLVLSIGQAQKYQHDIAPHVPLMVKLDGHFYTGKVNDLNYPRHTMFGSVEDAVKLGATAVGLTFYLGSEDIGNDIERIAEVRDEAHRFGLPLVLWSYPRGPLPDTTQANSLLWCHYAVSSAESLGADIVKTKFPSVVDPSKREAYDNFITKEYMKKIPEAGKYLELEPKKETLFEYEKEMKAKGEKPNYDSLLTYQQHVERTKIVIGAGERTLVIFSGGSKVKGDASKAVTESTKIIMDAGGEGRIIGRNFWGIPISEALQMLETATKVMQKEEYRRKF